MDKTVRSAGDGGEGVTDLDTVVSDVGHMCNHAPVSAHSLSRSHCLSADTFTVAGAVTYIDFGITRLQQWNLKRMSSADVQVSDDFVPHRFRETGVQCRLRSRYQWRWHLLEALRHTILADLHTVVADVGRMCNHAPVSPHSLSHSPNLSAGTSNTAGAFAYIAFVIFTPPRATNSHQMEHDFFSGGEP